MSRHLLALIVIASMVCVAQAAPPTSKRAATTAPSTDGEPCKGTLEIDGKTYKLQYAVAYAVRVFDKDAVAVIFSEVGIPVDKLRASLRESGNDDKFFHFKPHMTVTFDKSGEPMFCNGYADNNSISVSGPKLTGKLAVKDGRARGDAALASDPESKHKNSFKVPAFDLAMLVVPKSEAAAPEKPAKSEEPKADAEPGLAPIASRKLPLPDGATDVEYKKLVENIRCKCPKDLKATADEMTKKLAEQGWKTDGHDLVGPASAILKRTRGDATLTIFVKPIQAGGSTLQIMSKGLAWDDDDKKK